MQRSFARPGARKGDVVADKPHTCWGIAGEIKQARSSSGRMRHDENAIPPCRLSPVPAPRGAGTGPRARQACDAARSPARWRQPACDGGALAVVRARRLHAHGEGPAQGRHRYLEDPHVRGPVGRGGRARHARAQGRTRGTSAVDGRSSRPGASRSNPASRSIRFDGRDLNLKGSRAATARRPSAAGVRLRSKGKRTVNAREEKMPMSPRRPAPPHASTRRGP